MDRTKIMESEIRAAMKKMKRNKPCRPDDINLEILEALEEFVIKTITKIANDTYESVDIPEDLCSSIFVTIPKKPGEISCEFHRAISLLSHVTKLILRVIMARTKVKMQQRDSDVRYGFV